MSSNPFIEHLNDTDLALLATVSGEDSVIDLQHRLWADPQALEAILRQPSLFDILFGAGTREALFHASPFLTFAVLVQRASRDLSQARFVEEWIGPGRRVPMFGVTGVQEFASDPLRRLFLAELLASYTHVASGSMWIQTPRGWRRRRFSELDPVRLVEMLQSAPERERPVLYRRLGDLALFLTGVFPDYAGTRLLPGMQRQRLERRLGWVDLATVPAHSEGVLDDIALLEQLGQRSYRLAWIDSQDRGGMSPVLEDVAKGFGHARRILNFLTDQYVFSLREQWFPVAKS
jgi:hypothetical protein